jgi:hypothetical protein
MRRGDPLCYRASVFWSTGDDVWATVSMWLFGVRNCHALVAAWLARSAEAPQAVSLTRSIKPWGFYFDGLLYPLLSRAIYVLGKVARSRAAPPTPLETSPRNPDYQIARKANRRLT